MAYSKELETVIEAALADGVITEKERAVLHKKALLEGVDPDELDVVIEGRLAKMKREVDWLRPTPPKNLEKEKHGNVVKCPNCGAPIVAGATSCKDCGYVFTNVKANQTATALFEAIQKEMAADQLDSERDEKINALITTFPIPTSKEDILEFLYMGVPNAKKKGNFITLYPGISGMLIGGILICVGGILLSDSNHDIGDGIVFSAVFTWWLPFVIGGIMWFTMKEKAKELAEKNSRSSAWRSKCEQVIAKAKVAMIGDPDFDKIEAFEKKMKA